MEDEILEYLADNGFDIEHDTYGQIVIYTGLTDSDGVLRTMTEADFED